MGKEDNILKKAGTDNPFSVPDHYFEDFSRNLMAKLPEKEPLPLPEEPTLWQRVKPWIYMAAMFCGIMLSVRVFVGEPQKEEIPHINVADAENIPDEDWEIIIDRIMMDDYTIYQYLTDANFDPNY
ncbi:MAG: hypothetical protein IKJ10_05365 [Bacteroidaceae bacterium]|nr:hypothetical protein [Bacteroides sp.]MBR4044055.1 hypothetical protein [Bacteroidaceae bacterium]